MYCMLSELLIKAAGIVSKLTRMQSKTTSVPVGVWSTTYCALFRSRSSSSAPLDVALSEARGGGSGRFLIRVLQMSQVLFPYKCSV